jgi:hypothetical protein
MGASSISFNIVAKATQAEIEQALLEQQREDADYNGHRDGYSGDFQTVEGVDSSHLGKIYANEDDAYDFALENAEKWGAAVAVYYYADSDKEVHTLVGGWGAS